VLFELSDDLVDAVLGTDLVVHVLFDPVQPYQIKAVVFACLHA
jgi:hypothetical protein